MSGVEFDWGRDRFWLLAGLGVGGGGGGGA